ncbi:hypothetical protein D3C73_1418400 [compost metagenome]
MNICGIYLSLAIMNDNSGKAEYAVFAARNRMSAVTPWMIKYIVPLPKVASAICEITVA